MDPGARSLPHARSLAGVATTDEPAAAASTGPARQAGTASSAQAWSTTDATTQSTANVRPAVIATTRIGRAFDCGRRTGSCGPRITARRDGTDTRYVPGRDRDPASHARVAQRGVVRSA